MNVHELCFVSAKEMDVSNCESEEEELPRPETVTVIQDEFAEDTDPFVSHNSDPLSVDPLSLERSIEPPRQPIKEEQGDISEVCVKIELSDTEDEISNVSICHMPEDDGYRSGNDEDVLHKNQPKSNRINNAQTNINESVANKLNEKLGEVENANVKKGASAQEGNSKTRRSQGNGVSEIQANVCSNIDLCYPEVGSGILDRSCGSEVEVSQNQQKRTTKENNVNGPKETTCLERDNSNTLGSPFAETRQALAGNSFKTSVNFSKHKEPKERIEETEKLLPLCNIERKLKVVLTRCKEAEMLASSMKLAGQRLSERKHNNDVPAINLSPTRGNEINSVKGSRVHEMPEKKISILKIGRNRDANGWRVMSAGEKVSSKLRTKSAKVQKTVASQDLENALVPGDESASSVSRDKTISGKEVQDFSERRDELGEHQTADGTGGSVRKFLLENSSEGAVLKPWSCIICHKSFDNPFAMSGHTGHCKRRLKNERICRTLTDLKEHLQVVDRYKCEICQQKFASVKGMKLHKSRVGHNHDLKENEKHLNLNTPVAQLQDLQKFEEKLRNNPHTPIPNKCTASQYVKPIKNSNTDFSRVLPSRSRNVYSCDLCSLRFSNGLKLQVHALQHRKQTHYLNSLKGKLPQTASKINVKQRFRKGLQEHSGQCAEDKLYQCNERPEAFYARLGIKTHLNEHTGTRPYKCEKCGNAFYNKWSLARHKKLHKLEYVCSLCGISFSFSEQLENHKCSFTKPVTMIDEASEYLLQPLDSFNINSSKHNERHLEVNIKSSTAKTICKKNSCKICGKTMASRITLKKHMYLHIGKTKQCTFCDKKCSSSSRLKDHIRACHTFEKPYKCDLCDKAYASSNTLRIHKQKKHGNKKNMIKEISTEQHSATQENLVKQQKMRSHLIRKAFKCSKCPALLTTYGNLKRHLIRFHLKGKKEESVNIYKCEHCEASFHINSSLNRHINQFHSRKVKDMSAFKFVSPTSNEKDVSEVTITSSIAGNPGNHILDSEKPFQCNLCDKSFSLSSRLKDHLHCHTLEKPYQCHLCDKAYCSSDALRAHRNHKHKLKGKGIGKLVHQCDECQTQFSTSGYLLRHKNRFHLKNTQTEAIEEYKFEQRAASIQLIESVHQHNDLKSGNIEGSFASKSYPETKSIECNYCTASYNYCKSFVKHLFQNHGIKEVETPKLEFEVECDVCHRFLRKGNLKRHKRDVHNIEELEQDTSENILPDNILRHVRQKKTISSAYALNSQSNHQFNKCDTVFNQNKSLVKPKASVHVENKKKTFDINPSRKCGKSFKQLQNMEEHMLTHCNPTSLFHCDICSLSFQTLNDLKNHKQSHKCKSSLRIVESKSKELVSKKHKCDICNKLFSRKDAVNRHKKIHENVFPYKCEICEKQY
ncbi:Protein suppressor of hairy wing [Gryllus bimaculatus]|nr:Protein suppressor of hairy wing [Gryllus bimaculatus]